MAKRIAVTVVGAVLLLIGVALMVLPGPGILLIVAGLAVLASEYAWARRLLRRARARAEQAQRAAVSSPMRTAASVVFALGMVGLGIAMQVVPDVAWPVRDDLLDAVWRSLTGWVLIVTGLILLVTTAVALRDGRRAARAGAGRSAADGGAHQPVGTGARPLG
ncbi:PGPGW domain-containing protein [Quadrisphaera sp. DSM 44207]|uniref:PGPGW domain-containing protein n=1 Tax=Quadrisphaera sp. DSM 44207 TaxID=1881057 RepID=UPI00087E218B|nr:PGPGW domain-containing protein [Quadrisphaera sp. DSM 44207]SDQ85753.1 TIGR02611 family protein [Quadrisphaera sp. DSM 44207]